MTKFIACGCLEVFDGGGFDPPLTLIVKNGYLDGDMILINAFVKNGRLNFPTKIKEVEGDFYAPGFALVSLEGCPEEVNGYFDCTYNKLTTLEGAPEYVGKHFDCSVNELISLKGCPKKIYGSFKCNRNNLTSLEGCPEEVEGNFNIRNNTKQFTEEEVRAVCNVGGSVFV